MSALEGCRVKIYFCLDLEACTAKDISSGISKRHVRGNVPDTAGVTS